MGVLVNLGSDHLGDSGIPVPDQEEELSGGSGSTQPGCVYVCVCMCGAVTSIVRVSLTTGLLTDNRTTPSRRKPRAEPLSSSRTPS